MFNKVFIYGCLTVFVLSLIAMVPVTLIYGLVGAVVLLLLMVWCGYWVFEDTMNVLQVLEPVYWITRDNAPHGTPFLSVGLMRETDPPYRVGNGIQVRIVKYVFQVGICGRIEGADEYTPVMGHVLDNKPEEIGDWQ